MLASERDILLCQFDKWYRLFVGKTFKSVVIALPEDFVRYLGEDGVILPKSSDHYFTNDALSSDEEDERVKEVCENDVCEKEFGACRYDFSALENQLKGAIKDLRGEVMVKLNWSCPLDATWMNAGTLKCRSVSDVFSLLKSSDRVTFDLEHMFDHLQNDPVHISIKEANLSEAYASPVESNTAKQLFSPYLVVRKWANLNPAMEFRVFVKDKRILAMCQRDCCTYYDFLEAKLDHIQDLIYKFMGSHPAFGCPGSDGSAVYGNAKSTSTHSEPYNIPSGDGTSINPKGVLPPMPPSVAPGAGASTLKVATEAGAVAVPAESVAVSAMVVAEATVLPVSSFAMDVYVDGKDRVWVVDVNPFGEPTCALLFEWEELLALAAADAAPVADATTVVDVDVDAAPVADAPGAVHVVPLDANKASAAAAAAATSTTSAIVRIGGDGGAAAAAAVGVRPQQAQYCEFRTIESAGEVLQSAKGSKRGPIDVHAAVDFKNFMDICKAQQAQPQSDSESESDK
jgi:hypothetical protein